MVPWIVIAISRCEKILQFFKMDNKKKSTIIKNEKKNKIMHAIAIAAIIFILFLSLPVICQSHLESDEPPSFKYSREANENVDHTHHNDHHHHLHHHDHHHDFEENNKRLKRNPGTIKRTPLDMTSIWLNSIGSTLLISAAPFLLLYIIPLDNTESMRPRLKILLAFASGGLLGDAFLHLIPHASHSHSHQHGHEEHAHEHHNHNDHRPHANEHDDHSHLHEGNDHAHSHSHDMSIGIWILAGIIAFLVVDKLVRIIKGNGHGHSHGGEKIILPATSEDESEKEEKVNNKEKNEKLNNKIKNKKENAAHEEKENDVEISGYLNLAADFAHNFTDGLAIGASYLAGNSIGIITTITILMHEVPHEIGDFAILIKAGCSKKKAMMLQLVTAMGALAGTALALIGAADSDSTPTWVMPFTAGGFIYIATVSVLPELLEGSTKLVQSLKEIAALLAGVVIMVFIAMYE